MFVARNWYAVAAHNRNSAGPMKDRREQRGGNRNDYRDLMDEYWEDSPDQNPTETKEANQG